MAGKLAEFLVSLVKQIVNCRHLVVLVGIQALLSLLSLEAVLLKHADDGLLEGNLVLPDD